MPDVVWVKISGVDKTPVTIFNNVHDALRDDAHSLGLVIRWLRASAVEIIRRKIFVRDDWTCTHCGKPVTWDGPNKGEMHEREWRGRGGEISLENGTTLCNDCHQNDKIAGHGARRPQWSVRQ